MNLFNKLRDFLRGGLRNRKGGLAYIVGLSHTALNGRIVCTTRADERGYWFIDPPQHMVLSEFMQARNGRLCAPGEAVIAVSVHDENLMPIPDAKLSKEEVRDLYLPGPVRRKENA